MLQVTKELFLEKDYIQGIGFRGSIWVSDLKVSIHTLGETISVFCVDILPSFWENYPLQYQAYLEIKEGKVRG